MTLMNSKITFQRESSYDEMLANPSLLKHPHLLVVIDHREARVYQTELQGTQPLRVAPYDPFGYGRQLRYVEDDATGQRKPERSSFYADVAKMLQGAEAIMIFGHGTGAISAMGQLLAELKARHGDLARRVVGTFTVDQQHMSEAQLLAKARECYAHIPARK